MSFHFPFFKRDWLWIGVIGLVAAFLRLVNLGTLPYGFHNDEVMNGYVGRFILENGIDLYGNKWPLLYFNNFGDYPNVIPMYLSGLGTYLFGVTQFGVRFPIAVAGIVTVVLMYLWCRWLFKSQLAAILGALVLAVLPWHLVLSRATAEGVTATLFLILGFGLVFKALDQKKIWLYGVGVFALLATYLLYPGFRILVPLSFLSVIGVATTKQWRIIAAVTAVALLVITGSISSTEWGRGRFEQTSIFTHNNVIGGNSLRYNSALTGADVMVSRVLHNKMVLAFREIGRQYFTYFSSELWLGDAGKPLRYAIPEHGVGNFTVVGILLGGLGLQLVWPLTKMQISELFQKNRGRFMLGWMWVLLVSPLSAALTLEDVPNVHRAAPLGVLSIFVFTFLIAGALQIARNLKFKWIPMVVALGVVALSIETLYFWHFYSRVTPSTSILDRSEEQRSLAQWVIDHQNEYTHIFVPVYGAMPIHYLFVKQDFRPELAHQFRSGLMLDQVDNVTFMEDKCFPAGELITERAADGNFVAASRNECDTTSGYKNVDTIYYYNQLRAYRLVKYVPEPEK